MKYVLCSSVLLWVVRLALQYCDNIDKYRRKSSRLLLICGVKTKGCADSGELWSTPTSAYVRVLHMPGLGTRNVAILDTAAQLNSHTVKWNPTVCSSLYLIFAFPNTSHPSTLAFVSIHSSLKSLENKSFKGRGTHFRIFVLFVEDEYGHSQGPIPI